MVAAILGLLATEILKRRNPEALGAGTPARLLATLSALQVVVVVTFA